MIRSLRNSLKLYTGKFEGVVLISLTIVLPILLLEWFVLNIVYAFVFNDFTSALADLYYMALTFIALVLCQIPFIQFVKSFVNEGAIKYKSIYYIFATYAFSIFVFGLFFAFITSIGVLLFIIPGFIVMIFFFMAPYESVLEEKSVWKSIKTSFAFAKKKFFSLLFIILLISIIEIIIGWVSMYLVYSLTPSLFAQVAVQMLLNLLFFPFLTIWTSYFYLEWKEKHQLSQVHTKESFV